jgi:hypothetical protein
MISPAYDPAMRLKDRASELMDQARTLGDRATSTLEDLQDTATSVKVSTDTAALALLGLGAITLFTLILVIRIDYRLNVR